MGGSHRGRRSWVPVAAVLTALVGHWIANLLLDRDEYVGATARVLEHLHVPALVQTVVGGIAVLALIAWTRRRRARGDAQLLTDLGQLQVLGILILSQLVLFAGLEISERVAISALFGAPLHFELLGSGFFAELLIATASALVLTVLGAAARHLVLAVRSVPRDRARSRRTFPPKAGVRRLPQVLAGSGGVRAPPLLA